jgi:hypothetical protein
MKYSPDRDPRRMDLPKHPTYWLGSNSPPLPRIHRRLKSIAEPPPEREVSSNEGWVPNGSNSMTDPRFSGQEKSRDVLQQGKIPSTEVSACTEAIPSRRLLPKRVIHTHGETLRTEGLSPR